MVEELKLERNPGIAEQPEPPKTGFKGWVDKNRTLAGAGAGAVVGSVVPGIGTVIGAVVGAGVGYFSSKEKKG